MTQGLKYAPLTEHLARAAQRGDTQVEMTFTQVGDLVSGLPPSARKWRAWWSNDSKSEAQAWRAAGWHVAWVSLDHERVRFETGVVGGTRAARLAQERTRYEGARLTRPRG